MIEQEKQDLNVKYAEMLDEQPPVVDIKGAIVLRRQYFSHRKECNVTFRPNGLSSTRHV